MNTKIQELRRLGYSTEQAEFIIRNCGTGSGGFQSGNDCAKGKAGKDGDGDGEFEGDGKGASKGGGDKGGAKAKTADKGKRAKLTKEEIKAATPEQATFIEDEAEREEFVQAAVDAGRIDDERFGLQTEALKAKRDGNMRVYRRKMAERLKLKKEVAALEDKMRRIGEKAEINWDAAAESAYAMSLGGRDLTIIPDELGEPLEEMTAEELGTLEVFPNRPGRRSFSDRFLQLRKSGVPTRLALKMIIRNCGTGSGGFQSGNDCAAGKAGKDGDGDGEFEGDGKGSDGDGKAAKSPSGSSWNRQAAMSEEEVLATVDTYKGQDKVAEQAARSASQLESLGEISKVIDSYKARGSEEYSAARNKRDSIELQAIYERVNQRLQETKRAAKYEEDPAKTDALKKEVEEWRELSSRLDDVFDKLVEEEDNVGGPKMRRGGRPRGSAPKSKSPNKPSSRAFASRLIELRKAGIPTRMAIVQARASDD